MNAPLARYLTQFSAAPAVHAVAAPAPFEPRISLTVDELNMRLEAAGSAARSEIEARAKSESETRQDDIDAAVKNALADARAEWTRTQSDFLAARITEAVDELRGSIADGLVRALQPLLAEAVRARTLNELNQAIDKLLADSDRPLTSIRGPSDLIEPLRQIRGEMAIEWVHAEDCEVTVLADATRIDTFLSTALAGLAQPGS